MDDLISRKALLEDINAAAGNNFMGTMVAGTLSRFVKKQPAVDAVPVVHGKWIAYLDGEHLMPERYYKCSVCGDKGHRFRRNYCPECGAKMDGGNDND